MDPSKHSEDRGIIEKIASYIPGFHGYMQRQHRRESDQLLRDYMADRLQKSKSGIDNYMQGLIVQGQLDGLDQIERIRTKLDKLIAGLRGAMRGYSGLFDYVKVDEAVLDQVYRHDMVLVQQVEDLGAAIEELPTRTEPPTAVAMQLINSVEAVQQEFDKRGQILEGMSEQK